MDETVKKVYAWCLFLASLVIGFGVRVVQQLFLVNQETGFYTDGNITSIIVSLFLILGVVGVLLTCQMNRKEFPNEYIPQQSRVTGGVAYLTGALLIVQGIATLFRVGTSHTEGLSEAELVASGVQHPILYSILALTGIAAGIIVLVEASGFWLGRNPLRAVPVATLVPQLWGCMGLVILFIKFTEVVNTDENIYLILSMVFLLLFFSAQAKLLAGIEENRNMRLAYGFGLSAILLGVVTAAPDIIAFVIGAQQADGYLMLDRIMIFVLSCYVGAFLFSQNEIKNWLPSVNHTKHSTI